MPWAHAPENKFDQMQAYATGRVVYQPFAQEGAGWQSDLPRQIQPAELGRELGIRLAELHTLNVGSAAAHGHNLQLSLGLVKGEGRRLCGAQGHG